MNKNNSVGTRIREVREQQRRRQSEVAQLIGLSVPAYSKLESGITDINMSRLRQLAEVFGVTADSLVADTVKEDLLKRENEGLKVKLEAVQANCVELQGKLIKAYEVMLVMREKLKEIGGVDLLG